MAVATCTVVSGGGGWASVGAYPDNQNDGDNGTYQWCAGDTAGTNANYYDYTQLPDGAIISNVSVSGLWAAGSASATSAFYFIAPAGSISLGTIGDVASYSFNSATRPGGGTWTKDDVQALHLDTVSLQTGDGNAMRLKSSTLSVTYVPASTYFFPI